MRARNVHTAHDVGNLGLGYALRPLVLLRFRAKACLLMFALKKTSGAALSR
jgi:hypothetical protein